MSKISDIIKTKIEKLATKSRKRKVRAEEAGKENRRKLRRQERRVDRMLTKDEESRRYWEDGHTWSNPWDDTDYSREAINRERLEERRARSHHEKIRLKKYKFPKFDEDIPF